MREIPLKGNDSFDHAAALVAGHHELVALHDDHFKVNLDVGEALYIGIDSDYGETVGLNIYYYDASGQLLAEIQQSGQVKIEGGNRPVIIIWKSCPLSQVRGQCYQLDIRQGLAH